MRIRLFMRDGRTCYRLAKRADLGDLVKRSPENENRSIVAEVAFWNPMLGELSDFREVRIRAISKGSIGWVEEEPRVGA